MDLGTNRSASQWLIVLGILLILLSCLAFPVCTKAAARSKEYKSSDVPKDIPGRGTETSILTIADGGPILDLNVKVNFTHPSDADLDVFLIAPDGTRVELFTDVGGTSANFEDTILDDEASQSITDGSAPFAGSYRPEGSLAALNGKSIAGAWTLEVTDDWAVNRAGTLNSWSLIVESEAQEPLPAPVIHVEQSVPGGIYNTVCWEDGAAKPHQDYVSNVEVHIPDNGTATSTLTIEDVGMIADLNVKLDILHGRDSDLDVFLIAPDKTRVELFTDVGGQGYHFTDTVLDDDAAQSITEGSAPFTGTYRPEGNLSTLAGKEIHGTWTLEVTDDSAGAVGTLNHWSVSVAVADTLYYAECATDAGFANIAADSGWVSGNSYTFNGLAWNRQYWYRVKARPMETWCQTSQSDFAADTLTSTQTTEDGNVVLGRSGSGDRGPQVYVIQNPSFEYWGAWTFASNDPLLLANGVHIWGGLWSSDGLWAGGILMDTDSSYPKGDYGYLLQRNIDWTSVGTLVFDYCSFYGSDLTSQILIGDQEVWSHTHTDRWAADHFDLEVDVSGITGRKDLKLRTEVTGYSARNSAVLWDKLRTYSVVGYVSSGTVISTLVSIGPDDTWDLLRFNSTTPAGAALTVDVLPETGSMPIDPWRQIPGVGDGLVAMGLGDLAARTIRLRANLGTTNPSVTPVLHDWTLTYSDAARQSAWSNVESPPPSSDAGPIIIGVIRANGTPDYRDPIGQYTGNTSPLPTEEGGLKNGNLCFSDRTYPWVNTSSQLTGAEYVRTFNSDKKSTTVTYTVTTSREANVVITVDNRISDRQGAINQATVRFARAGTFMDTRQRLYIREDASTDRMQSVFSARLPAGTYVFSAMPSVNNFYVIAAMD